MEICGEHGVSTNDEVAHREGSCPACTQIEEMKQEHDALVDDLNNQIEELETEIATKDDEIEDLNNELEEAKN